MIFLLYLQVLDYFQYYMDLESANKEGDAQWISEYNLTTYYHGLGELSRNEISATSLHNLADRFTNPEDMLFSKWVCQRRVHILTNGHATFRKFYVVCNKLIPVIIYARAFRASGSKELLLFCSSDNSQSINQSRSIEASSSLLQLYNNNDMYLCAHGMAWQRAINSD